MKRRKILTITLALAFALAFTVPTYASEGTVEPPAIDQETSDPVPVPEEPPDPDEPPAFDEEEPSDEPQDPQPDPAEEIPEDGEVSDPVDSDPDSGENPEEPENPEPDDEENPEDPENPDPDGGENPEDPENPDPDGGENPEDSENPEDLEPWDEQDLIEVLVPDRGQVVINPYHMKVATRDGETRDQIVHEAQELVSYTNFPVQVSAQVVGSLLWESAARFVSAPPADDAMDKQIFMYVEFQPEPYLWSGVFGDWFNQILVTEWGESKDNVLTLAPFGVGYFRLFGAMTPFPDPMWSAADAPDVTVAFTFSPIILDDVSAVEEPVREGEADDLPPDWDTSWDMPADGGPEWEEPEDFYGPMDFYESVDDGSAYISEVF